MGTSYPSFAKINIGLKIVSRRKDGYHNLYTIFQELDFADFINIEKSDKGCNIKSDVDWMPINEKNICYKAYSFLKKEFDQIKGVSIKINKNIPVGSGLGGGSSNCAAVLKGLNSLYNLGLDNNNLQKIALKLGADVPFFIKGGVQLGEGIGEKLTKIKNSIPGYYLLIMPEIRIDTHWAYSQIKKKLNYGQNLSNFAGFLDGDFSSPKFFENDFERIVIPAYPEIGRIKKKILEFGALFSSLSGSGSTVYGIFNDEAIAKDAELFFRNSHNTILSKPK